MVSVSAECRPLYQPRYLPIVSQYLDHHSADILVDTSVDTLTDTSRSTYRPTRDRYVSRVSVDITTEMSTDISVEGCTKYTWSLHREIFYSIQNSRKKWFVTILVFEKMAIYFHGEVQPQRKSGHFWMRAHTNDAWNLCTLRMRNAILGNDLNLTK